MKFHDYSLSAVMLVLLTACGGGGGDGVQSIDAKAFDVKMSGGKTWIPIYGKFNVEGSDRSSLTINAILEDGVEVRPVDGVYHLRAGELTIEGLAFTYIPLSADAVKFSYTVSNGKKNSSGSVQIGESVTDPLLGEQWHLRNTGQKAFSGNDFVQGLIRAFQIEQGFTSAQADQYVADQFDAKHRVSGADMNVLGALKQGVTGKGVVAVVVDSGLDVAHEDLVDNVLPGRSVIFVGGEAKFADPVPNGESAFHGTSVAGLIAAVGWNGKGGRGVAPDAKLVGMRYLSASSTISTLQVHGFPGSGIKQDENVIFNRSYGYDTPAAWAHDPVTEYAMKYSATQLRNKKGAINLRAGGNSFEWFLGIGKFCENYGSLAIGLSCQATVMDPHANSPYYIVVGALNAAGTKASYSTARPSLLISAPGGEDGDIQPAMVTTDLSGCKDGASATPEKNPDIPDDLGPEIAKNKRPFDTGVDPKNANCNYTSTMNGTSSATPNLAGVVALMLEANPELTYRDVINILIKTAKKTDPNNKQVKLSLPDGVFIAHDSWTKNAAGFEFNDHYGFGAVDAGKAVALAKGYKSNLGDQKSSNWSGIGTFASNPAKLAIEVPDNSAVGAELQISLENDFILEYVQLKFDVSNSELTAEAKQEFNEYIQKNNEFYYKEIQTLAGADLAIEVISPQGTRSVILASGQALIMPALDENGNLVQGYILKNSVFGTNAFYGERSKGTWKIRVLDVGNKSIDGNPLALTARSEKMRNNVALSIVEGIALRIYGH